MHLAQCWITKKERHLLLVIMVFLLPQPISNLELHVHYVYICISLLTYRGFLSIGAPLQDTLMSWDITRPKGTRIGKHSHGDMKQHPGKLLNPKAQ